MAPGAKSYAILSGIITQVASRLNVMHLKAFDAAATLATPAIPLQDSTAELAVGFGLKL